MRLTSVQLSRTRQALRDYEDKIGPRSYPMTNCCSYAPVWIAAQELIDDLLSVIFPDAEAVIDYYMRRRTKENGK